MGDFNAHFGRQQEIERQNIIINFCNKYKIFTEPITYNTNDFNGINNTFFTNSFANTEISNSMRKMETGSVEQGSQSNQELKSTNGDFEWFYSWIDDWQIMPHTYQPKTSKDLVSRCPSCANKLKSTHKFCPDCGSEITGKALLEDVLQKLPKEDLIKMILGIK